MKLVKEKDVEIVVVDGDYIGGLIGSSTNKAELRILYNFVDRIDCSKIVSQSVVFEHGEVEKLFEEADITKANMKRKTIRLSKIIRLLSSTSRNSFEIVQVFEKVAFDRGEDGFWRLTLKCTDTAIESIFSADSIEAFKYKLRNILTLGNKYSCILFLLLENEREENEPDENGTIKIRYTISELKELLKCRGASYNDFKEFNQKVMKQCCREINENTSMRYEYEPVEKDENRCYTAVEFTLYP